jgi:hypothetical protein
VKHEAHVSFHLEVYLEAGGMKGWRDGKISKKKKRVCFGVELTFRNRASYIKDGHAPLPSRCYILYIFFQQI